MNVLDSEATEGDPLRFAVTLAGPVAYDVHVHLRTRDLSAGSPADYAGQTDLEVTIPNGSVRAVATVPTVADLVAEGDETMRIEIRSGGNAAPGSHPFAEGRIHNRIPPKVDIGDAETTEGDPLQFPVTMAQPTTYDVHVRFRTQDETAKSPFDYTAGTDVDVTIPAGQARAFLTVPTVADAQGESDETMRIEIRSGGNAAPGSHPFATGLIHNRVPPKVDIGDAETTEGDPLKFPVTMAQPTTYDVHVSVRTHDATAHAPADYTAADTIVVIPAGATGAFLTVPTAADFFAEGDETLTAQMQHGGNADPGAHGVASGTIHNRVPPKVDIGDAEAFEGDPLNFPVTMAQPTTYDIHAMVSVHGISATGVLDFTDLERVDVVIPAGQTRAVLTVPTRLDDVTEGDEAVRAGLNPGGNAAPGSHPQGTGTIHERPTAPQSGEHVLTGGSTGTVTYHVPGNPGWFDLDHATPLPMGVVLDTTHGDVVLRFAVPGGQPRAGSVQHVQRVHVSRGVVRIGQRRDGIPTVTLRGTKLNACPGGTARRTAVVGSVEPVLEVGASPGPSWPTARSR